MKDNKKKRKLIQRKKDHLSHFFLLNKFKVNQVKTFQESESLPSTTLKIKSQVIYLVG